MPEKKCTGCGLIKPYDQFYKAVRHVTGVRSRCKECSKLAVPNKVYNREHAANYYRNNRDKILARGKKYDLENPERRARYTVHYWANPVNRARHLYQNIVTRKKNKSFAITLTRARIEVSLMIGICERTGIPFDLSPHEKYYYNPLAPSIDRKDAFGDYSDDNIQVVCVAYNFGKNQMSDDEYIDFCRKVVAFADARKVK